MWFVFFFLTIISCKINHNDYFNEYKSLSEKFKKKDSLISENEIKNVLHILKKQKKDSLYYEISEKTIAYYYDINPEKALKYIKKNINYLSPTKDYKKLGINIQNASFVYADEQKNYNKSLKYCDKAIAIWISKKDTMRLANMLKYKGYLYGNLHKFPEAKKEIREAVQLYEDLKHETGVAVSYNNLASVFIEEKITDSALYYFEKSKLIWKKNNGFNRIFKININLLEIYRVNSNKEKFNEIHLENQDLIAKNSILKTYILDFEKITFP
jgi:tetratricopeptide (TPR) repeat protein